MSDHVDPQLYLVTPPVLEPAAFATLLDEALSAGPVACVQLWLPDADESQIRAAAARLKPVLDRHDTAFVLNGHVKLAAYLGCDGVHLDDAGAKEVKAAKKVLGDESIVGVSCRTSRHTSMLVGEAGADYVSFGPVFDTKTKGLPADPAAVEALEWWAEMMEVPCVAVGGITPENVGRVLKTGCEFVCAVSAVWDHPEGPGEAVRAFARALTS